MINDVTTNSFRVTFDAPQGNKGISYFEVIIEGGCMEKICKLDKSARPLQCDFTGLLPATRYAVDVRSCLSGSNGCGGNATALVTTTPGGTWIGPLTTVFLNSLFSHLFPLSLST